MDIIQAFEQFEMQLINQAAVLRTYHKELKKQGFTENQAFRLTQEMQQLMFKK